MNLTTLLFFHSKPLTFITVLLTFVFSCNNSNKSSTTGNVNRPKQQKIFALELPFTDNVFQINDTVNFSIRNKNKTSHVDSTIVYVEGEIIRKEAKSPLNFSSVSDFNKVGRQNLRIRIFYNDSLSQSLTTRITLLSDLPPHDLKFEIKRSITHNTASYTQGLFYHKGFLYEGTGKEGRSEIQKINPSDGSIVQERKLEPELFGEGITVYNNQIFQLTYRKKVGFVYDLGSFERIREFDLQTAEGWGLTTDGDHLIVSDGSSLLYFYHPEYFTQVNQLDVCDQRSLNSSLNELEYINGEIWANVYGKKHILRIDAATGKVTGVLDLSSIFPKDIPDDYEHVLNGIAYNPDQQTLFVTGKFWPVMYEIKVLE